MTFRVGTISTFSRVLMGIRTNQASSIRSQEQLASGRRILRPSDDPAGIAKMLSIQRNLAEVGRFDRAASNGLVTVETASSGLSQATSLMADARALVLDAMNGTLTPEDRTALASEFELIRSQMLELGNMSSRGRYLFGGTLTNELPWVEETGGGRTRVVYQGNSEEQEVQVGSGVGVSVNIPGLEIFGRLEPSGTEFVGLTGLSSGTTADEGTGYEYVVLRHDSTDPGALASVGVTLAGGGANDTLLGSNAITIDTTAGTVQLGSGPVVGIPGATAGDVADFTVRNELGGELHLDFTGFTGADYSGTVTAAGSVSIDGSSFQAVSFTETDLELRNAGTGSVVHLDTTAVRRAGEELVTFGGTLNLFDLFQGIAEDMRNEGGLEQHEIVDRLNDRLGELDRNHDNLLVSLGALGWRSQRLEVASERALDIEVDLQGLLSGVGDVDVAEVAVDLARSDLVLQVAQASGSRLLQTTLLNFL